MKSATMLPIGTAEMLEEARRELWGRGRLREAVIMGDVDSTDPHRVELRWRLALAQVLQLKRQLLIERYTMRFEPVPSDQPRLRRQLEALDLALGVCGVADRVAPAPDSTWPERWWRG